MILSAGSGNSLPSTHRCRRHMDRERIIVMAYGVSHRLYLENGPAIEAAKAQARSSAASYQSIWEALDPKQRMALIDPQLRTAA